MLKCYFQIYPSLCGHGLALFTLWLFLMRPSSFHTNESEKEPGVLFACVQCLLKEGAERKGHTVGV